jgi:4-carboxymuconolactone decarboxylase
VKASPRLAPLTPDTADPEVARILEKLSAAGVNQLAVGGLKVIGHAAAHFRAFIAMSDSLMSKSSVPADVRECMVVRMAIDRGIAYGVREHSEVAQTLGVSAEQLAAIAAAEWTAPLTDDQILGLRLWEDVRAGGDISDELWAEAEKRWGPKGCIDALFTIAFFGEMVMTILRGLRVDGLLDPPA